MAVTATIKVEKRTDINSRANKRLRKTGYLPGNIYGKNIESVPVTVKKDELKKSLIKNGRAAVFNLTIEGEEPYNVMVKEIQHAPLTGEMLHVDFQKISLTEEVKADVSISIVGKESIEAHKWVLIRQMDIIPVKGLPQDIPNLIEIDVAQLQLGDNIFVSDVQFPEGIVPDIDLEQLIVSVSEPKTQEEETDSEETGDLAIDAEEAVDAEAKEETSAE
jgi:large subunit ribosomal protein L25